VKPLNHSIKLRDNLILLPPGSSITTNSPFDGGIERESFIVSFTIEFANPLNSLTPPIKLIELL
jgi:hypothetical protein